MISQLCRYTNAARVALYDRAAAYVYNVTRVYRCSHSDTTHAAISADGNIGCRSVAGSATDADTAAAIAFMPPGAIHKVLTPKSQLVTLQLIHVFDIHYILLIPWQYVRFSSSYLLPR